MNLIEHFVNGKIIPGSSDRKGNGMIGLYDKDQKLQYTQKGEKKIIQQISVDDKKKKK